MEILLVDDNALQAETRRVILERSVASVRTARSGAEALAELAADDQGVIGMLVTDHVMPEMDGPSLVRAVRERWPELPVLVLSGMPDAERAYEGLDVTFRLKPFPPPELIRLARHLLGNQVLRSA